MAELLINGKDALLTWGVRMGTGFLDAIGAPAKMKDYITNSSRLEDGVRYSDNIKKLDERDITLPFTIVGEDRQDFVLKKHSFFDELYNADIEIEIPQNSDEVYYLKYTGNSVTYSQNMSRTAAKISAKFKEPNPRKRQKEQILNN